MRYADDIVIGAEYESDAKRLRVELQQRLERFGLELHAEKTRLLRFGRKAEAQRRTAGQSAPDTFDFLGFTHVCGRSKSGGYLLLRYTTKSRMRAKLKELREELVQRRHDPVPKQGAWVGAVVRGCFAYHAVPTNSRRLSSFRYEVTRSRAARASAPQPATPRDLGPNAATRQSLDSIGPDSSSIPVGSV